jgi:hypothetical protein
MTPDISDAGSAVTALMLGYANLHHKFPDRWWAELSIRHVPGQAWGLFRQDSDGGARPIADLVTSAISAHAELAATIIIARAEALLLQPWIATCPEEIRDLLMPEVRIHLDRRKLDAPVTTVTLQWNGPAGIALERGETAAIDDSIAGIGLRVEAAASAARDAFGGTVGCRHAKAITAADGAAAPPRWIIETRTYRADDETLWKKALGQSVPGAFFILAPDAETAVRGFVAGVAAHIALAARPVASSITLTSLKIISVAREEWRSDDFRQDLATLLRGKDVRRRRAAQMT